jgi:hypothetical protein
MSYAPNDPSKSFSRRIGYGIGTTPKRIFGAGILRLPVDVLIRRRIMRGTKLGNGRDIWRAAVLALALSAAVTAGARASDDGNGLYAIDLATGKTSRIGAIGDGAPIVGLAVSPQGASTLYGLTADNRLRQFTPFAPGVIQNEVEITGLPVGEWLVGIDLRPATGQLFAVSDSSAIYVVDPESGQATTIGDDFSPAIDGNLLGFDFNPTVDRIRLVDDAGQNLRLNPETGQIGSNPDTGAPTIDGAVAYAATDASAGLRPILSGAGYTNSVANAESTMLYVIDTAQDVLAIQDPPNDGVLWTVGSLGVDLDGPVGFDIAATGLAYVAQ